MVNRCVVHVGMHKTGTTSIQQTLFRNPSVQGCHYIDFDRPNASLPMLAAFADEPAALPIFRQLGLSADEVTRLGQTARDTLARGLRTKGDVDGDCHLISGEEISKLSESGVRRLHQFLCSHVDDVQVVGYVRDAQGYMESAFQQRLKGGLSRLRLRALYPNYRERFEKFDTVLGRRKVHLWHFKPAQFPNHCVVHDLCARLGLSVDPASIVRANDSMSREAAALMLLYNQHATPLPPGPSSAQLNQHVLDTLRQVPGAKLRLAPTKLARVFAKERADLIWIRKRTGVSMGQLTEPTADDILDEDDLCRLMPATLDCLRRLTGVVLTDNPDRAEIGQALNEWRTRAPSPVQVVTGQTTAMAPSALPHQHH